MGADGYELRSTRAGKGDGVFATRDFAAGETVMVGVVLAGLGSKVNHSCARIAASA